jgi:hypothetical protein
VQSFRRMGWKGDEVGNNWISGENDKGGEGRMNRL